MRRRIALRAGLAALSAALAVAVALAVAGCGGAAGTPGAPAREGAVTRAASTPVVPAADVRAARAAQATRAALAQAQRTHEYPTPVPRQTVAGGWRSPLQAVRVFADTYVNWTAKTIAPRLTALAEVSVGQARSAMNLAAGEASRDGELVRGGIANSGVVEAVGPLAGGSRDEYVVVTRERTTASAGTEYEGLQPTWHVSLATVVPVSGGLWVLSAWQPQS